MTDGSTFVANWTHYKNAYFFFFFPGAAACARQTMVPPPTSQAMNHLLVGKSALVSGKNRPLTLSSAAVSTKTRPTALNQNRRDKQGVTLHWKDTKKPKTQKPCNAASGKGNGLNLSTSYWISLLILNFPTRSNFKFASLLFIIYFIYRSMITNLRTMVMQGTSLVKYFLSIRIAYQWSRYKIHVQVSVLSTVARAVFVSSSFTFL